MKQITEIKLFSLALLFASSTSFSQMDKVGQMLGASTDDAQVMMEAYLTPFFNAFGAAINGGWYNTAKPHKLGGFDLTVSMNTAMVPDGAVSYDMNDLNLTATHSSDGIAPTFSGPKDAPQPLVEYHETILNQDVTLASYNVPKGTGAKFVPAPVIKLGLGFIKGTEFSGRYMPAMNLGKTNISLWGIGMKHSLKQYIPAIKRLPLINLSFQAGYTKLTTTNDLSITAADMQLQDNTSTIWMAGQTQWEGQQMQLLVSAFTTNILFSIDAPVITLYGGLGLATSNANLKLAGYYPFPSTNPIDYTLTSSKGIVTDNSALKDPIDIKVKNREGSMTKPRVNVGFRLKFAVVTFNFDYTRAYYNVFTGGIGVSFR